MPTTVEGIFKPNDTLVATLMSAMDAEGCNFFEKLSARLRVRRMSAGQRAELERRVTEKLLADADEGLVSLPVSATFESGVLVGAWQDLFKWFVDNLPAILEMIATIMALFAAPASVVTPLLIVILSILLLPSSAAAMLPDACPGGVCQSAARITTATARAAVRPVQQVKAAVTSSTPQRRAVCRGRFFRIFRCR